MNPAYAGRLFDYDLWANTRILNALESIPALQPASQEARWFSHIIAAQHVWLDRVQPSSASVLNPWPEMPPHTWASQLHAVHQAWKNLVASWEQGFDVPITYQNTKGHSFQTPLFEIITHVIIHGQHHRAQIASRLRAGNLVPPATDFIFFTRASAA